MSIYFIDGFDHYATAEVVRKWDYNLGGAIAGTNPRRVNSSHLRLSNAASPGQVYKTFTDTPVDAAVVGFALCVDTLSGTHSGFRLRLGLTDQCTVRVNDDGSISVLRGSHVGTELERSAAGVIVAGTWHWFEFEVYVHDSAGTYDVRVDGASVVDGTGADTKAGSSAGFDNVRLSGINHALADYLRVDDFFIGTGFLGNSRCDPLWPSAAGTHAEWSPLSGENWTNVDEQNDMDDDASYVAALILSKIDTYGFGDLKPLVSSTIHAVALNVACRKIDANARHLTPMTRVGGLDYAGVEKVVAAQTYAVVQHVWSVNPADSGAWEEADVGGAEFGFKLTGESAVTVVTQCAVEVLRGMAEEAVAPPSPVAVVIA